MWENESLSFSDGICRLCGCNRQQVYELGATSQNMETILTKIKRLIPIPIEETDRKPKQVCHQCVTRLEEYDSFVTMCLNTDLNFDETLGTNKARVVQTSGKCVVLLHNKPAVKKPDRQEVYLMLELNNLNVTGVNTISIEQPLDTRPTEPAPKPETSSSKNEKEKLGKHECSICHKVLARQSNLTTHMALHSQDRPHQCDQCQKRFVQQRELIVHKNIHSGTFTCEVCNKRFITMSKLSRHKKIHTGQKDFICSVCHKKFAEKNNMLVHMSIHTGARPFACATCKKTFRIQSHLNDHQKVHSSYTPFQCATCGRSFKWKVNLKDHLKVHTGEKFKCIRCLNEFKLRAEYYKHKKYCRAKLKLES